MSSSEDEDRVDEECLEWLTSLGLAEYAPLFVENYGLMTREDFDDYGCQCDLDEMNMPRALQRAYLRALGEFDSDDEAFDDDDEGADSDSVDSMDSETSQRYGDYLAAVEEDLDAALSVEQLEQANQEFRDGLVAEGFGAAGAKLEDKVQLPFLREQFLNQKTLSEELTIDIIKTATALLRAEPNVVQLRSGPGVTINVVGDIHGQYYDLVKLMDICGQVSKRQQYLFLGDYVDRGAFSCEVLLYVYALKIRYPKYVHLLRGNHEYTPDIRRFHGRYGFKTECTGKYGRGIYNQFLRSFLALPLAGLITTSHGDRILCVHAGLSEKLEKLEQLDDLERDKDYADWHIRHRWEDQHKAAQHEILEDLMWSDPMEDDNCCDDEQWVENKQRQCSVYYGANVTRAFLERNNLRTIVRAHQVQAKGGRAHFDEEIEQSGTAEGSADRKTKSKDGSTSPNSSDKSIRWLLHTPTTEEKTTTPVVGSRDVGAAPEQETTEKANTKATSKTKKKKKKFEKARSVFSSKEARKQRVRRLKRTNSAVKEVRCAFVALVSVLLLRMHVCVRACVQATHCRFHLFKIQRVTALGVAFFVLVLVVVFGNQTLKTGLVPEKLVPAFKDVFQRYRRSAGETFWDASGGGGLGGAPVSPSVKGPKLASAVVVDNGAGRTDTDASKTAASGGNKRGRRRIKSSGSVKAGDDGSSKSAGSISAKSSSGKMVVVAERDVLERSTVPPLITVFSAPNYRGEDRNLGGVLRVNDESVLLQRFTETNDDRSQNKPSLAADEEDERRFEELIPYMPFTYEDLLGACRTLEKQARARQLLGEIEGRSSRWVSMMRLWFFLLLAHPTPSFYLLRSNLSPARRRYHRRAASMTAASLSLSTDTAGTTDLASALAATGPTMVSRSVPTSPAGSQLDDATNLAQATSSVRPTLESETKAAKAPSLAGGLTGPSGTSTHAHGGESDAAGAKIAGEPAEAIAQTSSSTSNEDVGPEGIPKFKPSVESTPSTANGTTTSATTSPRRRAAFVPRYVGRRQSLSGRISFAKAAGKVRTVRRAANAVSTIKLHSSKSTPGRDRLSHLALSRGSVETASSIPLLSSLMSPDGSAQPRRVFGSNKSVATERQVDVPSRAMSNAELLASARRRSQGPTETAAAAAAAAAKSSGEFVPVQRGRSPTMPGRATTMPTLRAVFGAAVKRGKNPPRRHTSGTAEATLGDDAISTSPPPPSSTSTSTTDDKDSEASALHCATIARSKSDENGAEEMAVTPACVPDDEFGSDGESPGTTDRAESPGASATPNAKLRERFALISDSDLDLAALKANMTFSKDEIHVLKMCFLALDRDCNAEIDRVDIYGFGVDTPGDPCEEEVQEILRAMGGKPRNSDEGNAEGGPSGDITVSIEEYFNFAIALKKAYVLKQAKQNFRAAQNASPREVNGSETGEAAAKPNP